MIFNDYSQQQEGKVIYDYLSINNIQGICLDIGANDGSLFSNSLGFILQGWHGVLVEPSPVQFNKIIELHKGNPNVYSYNVAITETDGQFEMFSCSHDQDLVSTLIESETKRWTDGGFKFEPMKVKTQSWKTFLDNCHYKKFDYISIDAEGYDGTILKQMDLNELECKCLIIEHNGIEEIKNSFIAYCNKFNLNLIFDNGTNLIFVK